jgi:hypothetical protein
MVPRNTTSLVFIFISNKFLSFRTVVKEYCFQSFMFLFIESYVYVQLTYCPDDLCLSGPHLVNCVHHFSSLVIFIPIRDVLIILNLCYTLLGLSVTLPVCTRVLNHSFLFLCVCVHCELRYYPL